jgi:hypothetical protein
LRAEEIFRTKLKASQTLTAMALLMLEAAWIVRMGIVRMAGIVVGAAGGPVVVEGIGDAAGAVDGPVVVADGIAGAVGLAGGDTKNSLPRIFADLHG